MGQELDELKRIDGSRNVLGKPVPLAPNDAAMWHDGGRFHRVRRGQRFPWMSERDHGETKKIVREMLGIAAREIDDLDHVPFSVWLRERTDSERAIEFHNVMGGIDHQPARCPAQEHVHRHRRARLRVQGRRRDGP